jgi:glucose-6-phosphate 1-dehydrogenase
VIHNDTPRGSLKAYEALLLDAFKGDHSNFVRDDELDIAWKVCVRIGWRATCIQ